MQLLCGISDFFFFTIKQWLNNMLVFWFFTFYCQLLEILITFIFYNYYFHYFHQHFWVCFSCSSTIAIDSIITTITTAMSTPTTTKQATSAMYWALYEFQAYAKCLDLSHNPHDIHLGKVCISKHELNGPRFESLFCIVYLLFYLCKLLLENNWYYYIKKFAYKNAYNFITQKY